MQEKKNDFTCMKCGECCRWEGYVRLTEDETSKIAEYMNMGIEEFTSKYTRLTNDRRALSLIENEDGSCIFLDPDSANCIINSVKPEQCSDFPLKWNFEGWNEICKWGQANSK